MDLVRSASTFVVCALCTPCTLHAQSLSEPPQSESVDSPSNEADDDVDPIAADAGQNDTEPAMIDGDAGDETLEGLDDLDALDGLEGELDLMFEDFDVVVTAGRKAEAINLTAVPVSVLTAQEIHDSGVRTLPLLLDFVPGVDVLQVGRNRFAVGVRGLHHPFSDRTLFLMDGRNAGSGVFGGVDLQRLPLLIEDLERIEVVRGPGGAAWGANAFNGVINFINKDPRDTKGIFVTSTINEFGDTSSHLRWGAGLDEWSWRISLGYDDHETSEDAIINDDFTSRDFARVFRVTGDVVYELDDDTEITFGVGHSHIERGDSIFLGVQTGIDERFDYTRLYTGFDRTFANGDHLNLQLYGTFEDVSRPSLWRYSYTDVQLDGQYDFSVGDDHQMSVGGSVRNVSIQSTPDRSDVVIPEGTFDEQWAGVFVSDTWTIDDAWTLKMQGRLDWYSETSLDWSGRIGLLHALDSEKHHVLRIAAAKAFRAPQISLQELETERVPLPSPPFPPDTFGGVIFKNDGIDNEQIYSLEAGYFGQLSDQLSFRVDGYYQFYQDLSGVIDVVDPLMIPGRQVAIVDNLGSADAFGAETELTYDFDWGRIVAWYAYNDLVFNYEPQPNARAARPAKHKAGIRSTFELTQSTRFTVNYRYTHETVPNLPSFDPVTPSSNRLDLALGQRLFDGNAELSIGVQDLLDETDLAVSSAGNAGGIFETPGRTIWIRLQLQF